MEFLPIYIVFIGIPIYVVYEYIKFQRRRYKNIPKRVIKEITKLTKRDKDFIQNYFCPSVIILHNMFLKSDLAGEEFDKASIPVPHENPIQVSIKRKMLDSNYTNVQILNTGIYTTAKSIDWEVFIAGKPAAVVKWARTSLLGGTKTFSSVSDIVSLKIIEALSYEYLVKPFEEDP